MSERTEKTKQEVSNYPDIDEVYVVLRNKDTGKSSYVMLTGVDKVNLSYEMEMDCPEPVDLYGGLMQFLPNRKVLNTEVNFSARGVRRGLAMDIEDFPVEKMREILNGDQS